MLIPQVGPVEFESSQEESFGLCEIAKHLVDEGQVSLGLKRQRMVRSVPAPADLERFQENPLGVRGARLQVPNIPLTVHGKEDQGVLLAKQLARTAHDSGEERIGLCQLALVLVQQSKFVLGVQRVRVTELRLVNANYRLEVRLRQVIFAQPVISVTDCTPNFGLHARLVREAI